MAVVNGDLLKAVWQAKHDLPNTIIQNIFSFQASDMLVTEDVAVSIDIQDRLIEMFTTIAADLSTRYVLQQLRITNETQKTLISDGVGAGFAGVDAIGEVLPAQDAVLVLARSRTLGHQGRKYLGPIVESAVDNGDLTAGAKVDFNDFSNLYDIQWTSMVSGNTYLPGTIKYAVGGAPISFKAFDADLQKVLATIRTQRRRRPTVGLS